MAAEECEFCAGGQAYEAGNPVDMNPYLEPPPRLRESDPYAYYERPWVLWRMGYDIAGNRLADPAKL